MIFESILGETGAAVIELAAGAASPAGFASRDHDKKELEAKL